MRCLLMLMALTACPGGEDELECPSSPEPVTLASNLHADVFARDCTSCHSAADPGSGDFSTISKTLAATVGKTSQFAAGGSMKVVDPNNLGNSVLWLKVLGGDAAGKTGPHGEKVYGAMPLGAGLTAKQKTALKEWICSGAQ